MRPAWVPERARYDPKSFDLTDLVLDPDTKPAQPLVIPTDESVDSKGLGIAP
jgi:hypothetical protein